MGGRPGVGEKGGGEQAGGQQHCTELQTAYACWAAAETWHQCLSARQLLILRHEAQVLNAWCR